MIRLKKHAKPAVLAENEQAWTEEYLRYRNDPDSAPAASRFRYRNPEIKTVILGESYKKCVYCESRVTHVYRGETDHILPVKHRPELIYDWQNLAFVCKRCNEEKLDYYEPQEPLINPFVDDPADHMTFFGPLPLHVPGDDKGYRTIETLYLKRPELFERRVEALNRVQSLLDKWATKPEGRTKELVKAEILELAAPDAEYAATVRAFLFQAVGWKDFPE